MDAGTRDRFLTGVTGRLRQVLPRIRQATVFSESAEVLYDSSGFAGPIEIENFHRTREMPAVLAHEDASARCTYDDDGHCLALFSHPGPSGRGTWHVLLRVQEPRGTAHVGEATVRRLTPLLQRLFAPLARLPHHDPALERRLAVIARERDSDRRLAQLLLTAAETFGASAAFVTVPPLAVFASMFSRTAPRAWRSDPALRPWLDGLAPTRLKAAGAVRPKGIDGAPAHCTGVLCVPLTGLPGRTAGRFVLAFSADEPPSVSLPLLLRIAGLVVAALSEERDRSTGVWKQKPFLERAAQLRRRAPHAPIAALHVKADWTGWPPALEPRMKALQDAAAFLRATLPPEAVIGLARGGAFVALAGAPQPDDGVRLAAALDRAARSRPPSAEALPALAIRHVVAVPAPGAFRAALASLADAPVALTTCAPARIPAAMPPRANPAAVRHETVAKPSAPAARGSAAPTASGSSSPGAAMPAAPRRGATAARPQPVAAPLTYDPERLELLWNGGVERPALLVRPPGLREPAGGGLGRDVDTATTGVFVDAPAGIDMRYLDLVFADAADLARPCSLLLSVAAVSVTDRSFRSALRRLAEPLAARGHALHLLVSARYADEQPARLTALRDEGWHVGLHLFAGGRLQVRALEPARGELVYFAPDLVQDCLRSELSRLQVHTLLAQTRRAGFVPCAHAADVERLTTALSMDGRDEARRAG